MAKAKIPAKTGGPYTATQKKYIRNHFRSKRAEDIATDLNVGTRGVKEYIKRELGGIRAKEVNVDLDITTREYWTEIKSQYTKDELKMFIFHWNNIISQFQDDILFTEELQIVDLIRLEISIDRTQRHEKEVIDEIGVAKALLTEEQNKPQSDDPEEKIKQQTKCMGLERQLSIAQNDRGKTSEQFIELSKLKRELLTKLRAGRSDRISLVESTRGTFGSLIKRLNEDAKFRRDTGILIEKIRLASFLEYERLSSSHQFQDLEYDKPILNSETVLLEDDEKPVTDYVEIIQENEETLEGKEE